MRHDYLTNLAWSGSTGAGYRAYDRAHTVSATPAEASLHLSADGFGFEAEVTVKISQLGCRLYEVPISYHGREYWEGKKIGWRDGVQALWLILRHSLAPSDAGLTTLRRVIFPALRPALITSFAMAFARGVGEYGSIVFISGNLPNKTEIAPLLIVTKLEQYDYAGAASVGVVMLAISFVFLLGINLLQRRTLGKA